MVMIGILMALQVNNWNEERAIQKEFKVSFQKLLTDLESDAAVLELLDSVYLAQAAIGENIQNLLGANNSLSDIDQIRSFPRMSNTSMTYSNSTYRSLVNTGLLYKLKDQELANMIDSYYINMEEQARITQNMGDSNRNIRDSEVLFPFQYILRTTDNVFKANANALQWMNDDQSEIFQAAQYYLRIYVRQNFQKSNMVKQSLENNNKLRQTLSDMDL